MSIRFTQVDAFAAAPFRGNPAAVIVLARWPSDAWMQAVAAEMNLSETAFLVRRAISAGEPPSFDLRWFTPEVEVALCGHATLASARVLWDGDATVGESVAPGGDPTDGASIATAGEIVFHTKSGALRALRGAGAAIELDFPATPPREAAAPAGLAAALGVEPLWVGKARNDVFVEVGEEAAVRGARPDFERLGQVEARGIVLTARAAAAGCGYDFVSRFFAPRVGIAEDPVTGSAHCALAPFWSGRLGRTELVGYQASRRGGTLRVRVAGDRVFLGGEAVVVARGELLVEPA
jgi:PhzF family phenazine biosynthesis protein